MFPLVFICFFVALWQPLGKGHFAKCCYYKYIPSYATKENTVNLLPLIAPPTGISTQAESGQVHAALYHF